MTDVAAVLSAEKRNLATRLWEVGAVMGRSRSPEGRGFRLKLHEKDPNAPLSPIYLNLRTPDNPKPGPLTPDLVEEIGAVLGREALLFQPVVHIAGIPRAGDPLAAAALHFLTGHGHLTNLIKLEKEEGGDGSRRITKVVRESPISRWLRDDPVVLVDDLITKADTKLEAAAALVEAGLRVGGIVVLVDRHQGGSVELLRQGYPFSAVFTLSELLDFYRESGMMPEAEHREVVGYLAAQS